MDKYFLVTFNRVYITLFLWFLIGFFTRIYDGHVDYEQFGRTIGGFLLVGLVRVFYIICLKWANR